MTELAAAVASGDRAGALRALAARIASDLEVCKPNETAPLARQLSQVLREVEQLTPKESSKVDDLAKRRAARRSNAANQ